MSGVDNQLSSAEPAVVEMDCSRHEVVAEVPEELASIIRYMKWEPEKHDYFGFGSDARMQEFLTILPQAMSADSLATMCVVRRRAGPGSHLIFFRDGEKFRLGESGPSSNGPRGETQGGVEITATHQGAVNHQKDPWKQGAPLRSAERTIVQRCTELGAVGLVIASTEMLPTLRALGLFVDRPTVGASACEWLADMSERSNFAWAWEGGTERPKLILENPGLNIGVRLLRDVTAEVSPYFRIAD